LLLHDLSPAADAKNGGCGYHAGRNPIMFVLERANYYGRKARRLIQINAATAGKCNQRYCWARRGETAGRGGRLVAAKPLEKLEPTYAWHMQLE